MVLTIKISYFTFVAVEETYLSNWAVIGLKECLRTLRGYEHLSSDVTMKGSPEVSSHISSLAHSVLICSTACGKWYSSVQDHDSIISPCRSSFYSLWRSGNEIKYLVVWLLLFSRILVLCVLKIKKNITPGCLSLSIGSSCWKDVKSVQVF